MKEKTTVLKCEELETILSADVWNNGAYTGFAVGLTVLAVTAGSVAYLAFT